MPLWMEIFFELIHARPLPNSVYLPPDQWERLDAEMVEWLKLGWPGEPPMRPGAKEALINGVRILPMQGQGVRG